MDKKQKTPKKIYMFVVKTSEEEKEFFSKEELEAFKEKYNAYYKKKRVKRLFANLEYDDRYIGFVCVKSDILDRTEPIERTLKECDEITTEFKNAKEFKEYFNIKEKSWSIPLVAYKNNGIIKTIGVAYEKHKPYLEKESLTDKMIDLALDNPNFIEDLNIWEDANNNKGVSLALEYLLRTKRKYDYSEKYNSYDINIVRNDYLNKLKQFIYQWCNPKNNKDVRTFSYRRLRDLGFFTYDKFISYQEEKEEVKEKEKQISFFDDKKLKL